MRSAACAAAANGVRGGAPAAAGGCLTGPKWLQVARLAGRTPASARRSRLDGDARACLAAAAHVPATGRHSCLRRQGRSRLHGDAHVLGGTHDGVAGGVQVRAVQVGQLDGRNLTHLRVVTKGEERPTLCSNRK